MKEGAAPPTAFSGNGIYALPISASPARSAHSFPLRKLFLVALGLVITYSTIASHFSQQNLHHCGENIHNQNNVSWKSCGDGLDGFQCTNITVPLDHHDTTDNRSVSIAVTRLSATDQENRKGAIFLNPGGPGGSGTNFVYKRGPRLSKLLKGQYDFIGFDPRGINLTLPYVSCFASQLEAEIFSVANNGFRLNLPANLTAFPGAEEDVTRQIQQHEAAMRTLAKKCQQRTGDYIAYFGTEAVIRDIDYISRKIQGESTPINFWGFSYGTVIGQYLVKLLPPERIGRVIIDAVVNPDVWQLTATSAFEEGLDNIDDVLYSFASSCLDAGKNCSLNAHKFDSPEALLSKIDYTLDALYARPVAIHDLDIPAVATASNLRRLLFQSTYSIQTWNRLADSLSAAFEGNFTVVVNETVLRYDVSHASEHDESVCSSQAIFCADTHPYTTERPAPDAAELAKLTLKALKRYSRRVGDQFFGLSLCHVWDEAGALPRKSYYGGTFELPDNTLTTPILVLSNTYDPVTSLDSAKRANDRLGNNARLVQQTDGWGHTTLSHVSYCTARIVRAYWLNDELPPQKHTLCGVDQKPWQPFDDSVVIKLVDNDVDEDLRAAWKDVADGWHEFL